MISSFKVNTTEKDLPYSIFYDSGLEEVMPHWHKEIEIVYCKKGSTEMSVNNKKCVLREGDIGVALGGDVHCYALSENHTRTVIIFDTAIFKNGTFKLSGEHSLKKRLDTIYRFSQDWSGQTAEKARKIILNLERLKDSDEFGRTIDVFARICDLVLLFCNEVPHGNENTDGVSNYNQTKMLENFEKMFEYIENHYNEKITLEYAAGLLNFNPSYFARSFHKITGTTFLTYLNTYRINKARNLLSSTGMSISEITGLVGFGSTKTFNRVFKQIVGTSPTQYRKNNESNTKLKEENV